MRHHRVWKGLALLLLFGGVIAAAVLSDVDPAALSLTERITGLPIRAGYGRWQQERDRIVEKKRAFYRRHVPPGR